MSLRNRLLSVCILICAAMLMSPTSLPAKAPKMSPEENAGGAPKPKKNKAPKESKTKGDKKAGKSDKTQGAGWTGQDIGKAPKPGSSQMSSEGEFEISSCGAGIGGTNDAFHFFFQKFTGDFEFEARVVNPGKLTMRGEAKAGLMIRESLDPAAPYEMVYAPTGPEAIADYRLKSGATDLSHTLSRLAWQPCWLKIARVDERVAVWHSTDRNLWYPARFGGTLRGLPKEVYVGLATSGGEDGAQNTATFDNVTLKPFDPPYRTSWIGNSLPGGEEWVMAHAAAMYVDPDTGTIYLNGNDEKKSASVYDTNGNHIAYGVDSHFRAGTAITADRKYFYHSMSAKHGGGVRRYFLDGSQTPEPWTCLDGKIITGLAVRDGHLYAADSTDNKIHVLRASDLKEESQFAFERPANIAIDPNGNLWIIRNQSESASSPAVVLHYRPDGTPLPEKITGVKTPRGIAVHPNDGWVYVADYLTDMQIHIFNADGSHVSDFGDLNGIYSGVKGEVKPTKLDCPVGVGVDKQGNLYVAANGPKTSRGLDLISGTGTELRKFSLTGDLIWERYGLEYLDCADADPATDGVDLFTKETHYVMDYSKPTGHEWTYKGMTLDGQTYPKDPRITEEKTAAVSVRRIGGARIMVMNDNTHHYLYFYRFVPNSEIAIPCGGVSQDKDGKWYWWRDLNGDGQIDKNEEDTSAPADNTIKGWQVDGEGGLWAASPTGGVMYFKCQGLGEHGVPIYEPGNKKTWPVPAEFSETNRLFYVPATDTLYLGGYTPEHPRLGHEWKQFGTEVIRYDNWLKGPCRMAWRITLPYGPKIKGGHVGDVAQCLSVAGDYLFVLISGDTSAIPVYETATGRHVITLCPGPEVAGITGLVDIKQGLNVWQRKDGEYLIFAEEDSRAKVLMYRWRPKKPVQTR